MVKIANNYCPQDVPIVTTSLQSAVDVDALTAGWHTMARPVDITVASETGGQRGLVPPHFSERGGRTPSL